jgi:hypothetical protein
VRELWSSKRTAFRICCGYGLSGNSRPSFSAALLLKVLQIVHDAAKCEGVPHFERQSGRNAPIFLMT